MATNADLNNTVSWADINALVRSQDASERERGLELAAAYFAAHANSGVVSQDADHPHANIVSGSNQDNSSGFACDLCNAEMRTKAGLARHRNSATCLARQQSSETRVGYITTTTDPVTASKVLIAFGKQTGANRVIRKGDWIILQYPDKPDTNVVSRLKSWGMRYYSKGKVARMFGGPYWVHEAYGHRTSDINKVTYLWNRDS